MNSGQVRFPLQNPHRALHVTVILFCFCFCFFFVNLYVFSQRYDILMGRKPRRTTVQPPKPIKLMAYPAPAEVLAATV